MAVAVPTKKIPENRNPCPNISIASVCVCASVSVCIYVRVRFVYPFSVQFLSCSKLYRTTATKLMFIYVIELKKGLRRNQSVALIFFVNLYKEKSRAGRGERGKGSGKNCVKFYTTHK